MEEKRIDIEGRIDLLSDLQLKWLRACLKRNEDETYYIDDDGKLCCRHIPGDFLFNVYRSPLDRIPISMGEYSQRIRIVGYDPTDILYAKKSNLKSFAGFSNDVAVEIFCVRSCDELVSLEGSPRKANLLYLLSECQGLKTLEGISPDIGRLVFQKCRELVSLKGIKKMTNITFDLDTFSKVRNPQEHECMVNVDLFKKWQRSGLEFSEFIERYSGMVDGSKYGI